jgi:hypothetical protein
MSILDAMGIMVLLLVGPFMVTVGIVAGIKIATDWLGPINVGLNIGTVTVNQRIRNEVDS